MLEFNWVNEDARKFMSGGYLEGEETVESRSEDLAEAFYELLIKSGVPESKSKELRDNFLLYLSLGFYSLSSPVWANFGRTRGLPISCNNSYIPDSIEGMVYKRAEIAMMTKHGAGTSAWLGDIRPRGATISAGGYADGVRLPALEIESCIDNISQGNVRRGNAAVYYPVEGEDIEEFLNFREEGSPIQKISLGVTISDQWMTEMVNGDKEKRKLWGKIIKKRFESGYPYISFSDTLNKNSPDVYQDLGRKINGSNLCNEIALSSTEDESFVCNLSSLNLLKFDEWEHTDAPEVLVWFLDMVMEEYIHKTEDIAFMEHARNFAIRQRALGVGTLGYHSYLQSKMIPFESIEAKFFNSRSHKLIQEKTLKASKEIAGVLGEPEMLVGYGRRNVTLMAIAPTTSSSFILGQVSPSIEPLASNYYTKDLAKGKFTYRNPFLKKLLEDKGADTHQTWVSILEHGGSVQHLGCLTAEEKLIFKTFSEISPLEIIQQAAARQNFIDQSQSLNLLIRPDAPLKDVNKLMITAWESGVKGLYYQRSTNPAQDAAKNITACVACEG